MSTHAQAILKGLEQAQELGAVAALKFDGVWRPEKTLIADEWWAVRYAEIPSQRGNRPARCRQVHCDTRRGQRRAVFFKSVADAQAKCDELNGKGS